MIEERRARPQQTAVPPGRRATHESRVYANHRNAGALKLIDRGESAAPKTNDAGIGLHFSPQRRKRPGLVRCGNVSIPDGSIQKYVANDARSLTKSLRLLNGS